MITYILLLLTLLYGSPVKILEVLNKERTLYGQEQVSYDYDLHEKLISFNNTEWFHEISNYSYTIKRYNRIQNLNCQFAMNEPFFKDYVSNWSYFFRDTHKDYIYKIFEYRNRQRSCFDYSTCSRTFFDDFVTCLKNPSPSSVIGNSKRCSWAMYYHPRMIHKDLLKIACITLNKSGPAVPLHLVNIQKNSFVCYALFKKPFESDYPFKNKVLIKKG